MRDDDATVLDIVLACRRISRFIAGADQGTFLDDDEKHWAVVSQLMLIGEAVRRLSTELCDGHAAIPWPQMAGMRNRLIHHYDKIDWPLVWTTAVRDVPILLAELEPLVAGSADDASA